MFTYITLPIVIKITGVVKTVINLLYYPDSICSPSSDMVFSDKDCNLGVVHVDMSFEPNKEFPIGILTVLLSCKLK